MPLYETVQIARQDISANQVETLTEQFGKVIEEYGGTVIRTEQCGLRTLAYKINKNRKGHYTIYYLDCAPDALAEMERQMRLSEDIMRYLSLRVDAHPEGPSILSQQAKGERSERGGRGGRGERGERGDRQRGSDSAESRKDSEEGASDQPKQEEAV